MDPELIGALIFVLILSILLFKNRKKVSIQKIFFPFFYLIILKTKLGLKFMNLIAKKHPKLVSIFSKFAIWTGFVGMIFIAYTLITNFIQLVTIPAASSSMGVVLPIPVNGAFYVPFFYWIVSIFILATVHEFAHGVVARFHKVKVKSSGFGFFSILLPAIPLAFVEPDQEKINKLKTNQKLSIFAAGPFANILLGIIILILSAFIIAPVTSNYVYEFDGIVVTGIAGYGNQTMPAEIAGINSGEIIQSIDGVEILYIEDFTNSLNQNAPGDTISVTTNNQNYNVTLISSPDNPEQAYFGVFVSQHKTIRESLSNFCGGFFVGPITWIIGLMYWLYLLNIGIGLFNLVPLGIVDGGQMLKTVLVRWIKKEKLALGLFKFISSFFLFLVAVSILYAFF